MNLRTSIHAPRFGLVTRIALVPAVFAVMALAAGSGAQAGGGSTRALKSDPVPVFAANYVKNKLLGKAVARARYDRYHTARLRNKFGKAPIQVVADFNGDGKRDWAGLVRTRKGVINLVVIYSKGQQYRHALLQKDVGRSGYNLGVSVHLQKPGRIKGFPAENNPKNVRLVLPGVEFVYFEKSSVVYYWKERQFAAIWTSD